MSRAERPRRSREELRALLMDVGQSILLEEGLGARADALTFKRAFERIKSDTGVGLTNASVIGRLWTNQADYQTDVLVALASDRSRSTVNEVADVVAKVLEECDLSTPEARAASLREVCRVAGETQGNALRHSASWSLWINLWAMATSSSLADRQHRILTTLMEGYEEINQHAEEVFGFLMMLLGYRLRAPLTIRQFLNAAGALSEGCSLRDRVDSRMVGIVRPTGPDGEDQEWTIYAIGLEALTREFFESDPDYGAEPAD